MYDLVKNNMNLNKIFVNDALEIFSDLDLVKRNNNTVTIESKPDYKLDLSDSIRYNENTSVIDKFNYFSKLAFNKNLFLLINEINNFLEEE